MTGRLEVRRLRQRLDATFKRIGGVGPDPEVQSDFARYLCVLVSGFLENAVVDLVLQHARLAGAPSMQRFVDQRTKNFTNAKTQRLCDLLGDFDAEWQTLFRAYVIGDLKDAVDAVVSLRNQIAHGQSVSLTYAAISDYYLRINKVVDFIADLCDPIH